MIQTRWFTLPVLGPRHGFFLLSAICYFFPRVLLFSIFSKRRTVEKVRRNYDDRRRKMLDEFKRDQPTLQEFVFGKHSEKDFFLRDNRVVYGNHDEPKMAVMKEIEISLKPYLDGTRGAIVEFGSGSGRNLIWLKRKYPSAKLIGFELSQESVDYARHAAEYFGVDVTFIQANVCESIPTLSTEVSVCFSSHALEMMPRIYVHAARNMIQLAAHEALFFEPTTELYPWSLRGVVARWRAVVNDRLRGLLGFLQREYSLKMRTSRLPCSGNPLNETCLICVSK